MELGRPIKLVYDDNGETKVLKGSLIDEDDFTVTIKLTDRLKTLMIGKRFLLKLTYTDEVIDYPNDRR